MYTQCPECSTAFRVTADILKQAAGKVRCGGCGRAFNALEFLSETRPEQKPASVAEDDLPELKPEPLDDEGLPRSISAEQSAALLKTLDDLAGSDIRIEDTGVEWRVLDEDEIGEAAGDPIAMSAWLPCAMRPSSHRTVTRSPSRSIPTARAPFSSRTPRRRKSCSSAAATSGSFCGNTC